MKIELFVSCDGNLFNTSAADWSTKPPLRENYRITHNEIKTVADLKATLRAGSFTNIGCYPLYFITLDGAALSFESVLENFADIVGDIRHNRNNGWRVVACDVNWEDIELYCDHSNKKIDSAYGGEQCFKTEDK